MNFADISIRNKVTTLILLFTIMGIGFLSYGQLGRLEDPEFTIKEAQIITPYPGASAKQVEEEVTDRIEIAVQSLKQLKRVTSISKAGVSIVTAEMEDKYDKNSLPQVWDELRNKISDIQTTLPTGAGPAVVYDDYGDVYGILLAITGKGYSYKELEQSVDFLKRELLLVPDVAKIALVGIQPQQVHIEIIRERLAQLGISLEQISQTLKEQNLVVNAGNVKVGTEYVRISPTGNFTDVKQIGDLLIKGSVPGKLIYLRDVGTISETYQTPPDLLVHHNGIDSYVLAVAIKPGGNVVNMGLALKKRLSQLTAQLPLGIEIHTITFQPDLVTTSIDDFVISLVEALAIVVAVLVIFMGLRSSLIISAALLLTIFGTFIGMYMWSINLERISLGALIIALGMLVDNAIVINDGILIRIEQGMERIKAAKEVVKQNSMPLLGATLIAILAFAAIGLSQDATGEYTRSLFQVILISLLLSWIVAVTATPLLCVMFLKVKKQQEITDPYGGKFYQLYRSFLGYCLRFRYITSGIVIGLLVLAIYGFSFLENSFFPDSTRPQFMLHYWLPEGTDIRETNKKVTDLEKYIKTIPNVTGVTAFIGQGAPRFLLTYSPEKPYSSYAYLLINLTNYREIDPIAKKIAAYTEKNHVGTLVKMQKFILGPSKEDTLEFRFSGPNATILRELSEQAKKTMHANSKVVAIKDNWRERVKIVQPVFSEQQARNLGISKADLDKTLQMTYNGFPVGIYREFDKILPILAISTSYERESVDNLKNIYIWSPIAQKNVPLRQIVSGFNTSWEDSVIHRRDRRPTITAQGTQKSGNASVVFSQLKPQLEAIQIPPGYTLEFGGEYEKARDAKKALFKNIPLVLVLMVLILVMLFNATRQPLIIILTVPLAVIGVTLGLIMTGQSFGFMAMLGFLSLSGMLIKNAVVLIDQIDLEIREGKSVYDAIISSSVSRLRPVAMAAITTVLGMIPLLFDIFFAGMAITIMAGLTFATVLTLVVVPAFYAILFKNTPTDLKN